MPGSQQLGNHGQRWGKSEARPDSTPKQRHKKPDQTSQIGPRQRRSEILTRGEKAQNPPPKEATFPGNKYATP